MKQDTAILLGPELERAILQGRNRRESPMAAGVPFPAAAVRAAQEARKANPTLASHIAAVLCGCVVSDALLESNKGEEVSTTCDHCGEQHVPTLDHMYWVCKANADLRQGFPIPTADLTRRLGWPTVDLTCRTTTIWTKMVLAMASMRQRALDHRHKKRQ